MTRTTYTLLLLLLLVVSAVFLWNYVSVQRPLDMILDGDMRNSGVIAKAHFARYIQPNELVFDLRSVGLEKAPTDVFRVLLQFAEALQDRSFDTVVLAHRGDPRFHLEGHYFQRLGREYATQNPVFTIRTFPEHLFRPDGTKAFGEWTGGLLGVVKEQMEDHSEFHQQWYLEDLSKQR